MRRVLLDANMLIGALEPEPGNEAHQKAGELYLALTNDPDVELFITPLVRYEALRGVVRIPFDEMKSALDELQEIDVHDVEANRAAEIFRLAKGQWEQVNPEVNLNKRSFDFFHCACEEINGLEIDGDDPHIQKIKQLIQDGKQNAQTY
ncbi:MAG: PIN domain-containing protein [Candidatus Accumulibacter sp.]|nr:PIN domain-containing protein [Accumulibacter sp.]